MNGKWTVGSTTRSIATGQMITAHFCFTGDDADERRFELPKGIRRPRLQDRVVQLPDGRLVHTGYLRVIARTGTMADLMAGHTGLADDPWLYGRTWETP